MEHNKSIIKTLLRENLFPVQETEKEMPPATTDKKKEREEHSSSFETNYSELERKLDGTLLKANQVMAAAGLGNPDDATDRSLFSKKIRREKNDEGGLYMFSDEDLAKIIKVINNPTAYLNVKK
jgi:hypothetical protein